MEELLKIVKGPDFPTERRFWGQEELEEAYRTGRGKIRVRAVTNIETMSNGKSRIVVTELPYMVNKARLIENIADLVKEIAESSASPISETSPAGRLRINIELRKDVKPM